MKKGVAFLLLLAIAASGLMGLWLGRTSTHGVNPVEDAHVRASAQVWAHQQGMWGPATIIETLLQFEGCSTLLIRPSGSASVPIVAVRRDGVWKSSRALNETNDADDVTSAADCLSRYQE